MWKLGALVLSKRFSTAPFFSNGLIRLHCTLSKLLAPNFNRENLDVMQAEKEHTEPKFSIVPRTFQRLCDDYQCLILVFSVIYLDSWDISGGVPVRVFEKFRSLFYFLSFFSFFFFFFSFLLFIFFFFFVLSLSRGPL